MKIISKQKYIHTNQRKTNTMKYTCLLPYLDKCTVKEAVCVHMNSNETWGDTW